MHRLIAQYFIPNPNNYPIINHIDCNPSNNHYSNLEWCTQKQNIMHAMKLGRMVATRTGKIAWNSRKVINEETGEIFTSIELASKIYGRLSPKSIRDRLNGLIRNDTPLRCYLPNLTPTKTDSNG